MEDKTLKQIVIDNPQASSTLEQFQLDFCCGGDKTLKQACLEKGVDLQKVIQTLQHSQQQPISHGQQNLDQLSAQELWDYIVKTHHQFLKTEIPPLLQLMDKVNRVHSAKHPELTQLHQVVHDSMKHLLDHLEYEESTFPKLHTDELGKEHEDQGKSFETIATLTNNFEPPADACNSYKMLYKRLRTVVEDTHKHVNAEN
jgi:regulator of cell morphogenesis and NO signaling